MLKNDFLEMMHQDLETSNNENAKQVLRCFEEVLKDYPSTVEIDSSKSCEDCYKQMEIAAKEKAVNGSYCFAGDSLRTFIIKYLDLPVLAKDAIKKVRLEDFF